MPRLKTPTIRECPDCAGESPVLLVNGVCPACGGGTSSKDSELRDRLQCSWRTDGRRCLMFADHGPSDRPGLCGYHFMVKGTGLIRSDEYVVFERWVTSLRRYCAPWSHYPPEVLWDWLQGRARDAAPALCARGEACRLWNPPTGPRPDELRAASRQLADLTARIGGSP